MKKNILVSLTLLGLSSYLFAQDCVRNTDETVTCSNTGLTWQDNDDVLKEDWKTWEEALTYCNTLPLAGGNWRLPNIKELKSITDKINKVNPSIKDGFTKVSDDGYWSSTTDKSDRSNAWGVNFGNGYDDWDDKAGRGSVRCVR